MKIFGGLIIAALVSGCATTKSADTYPDSSAQSMVISGSMQPTGTLMPIDAARPLAYNGASTPYKTQDMCYVIIENMLPSVEICQKGNVIRYNPITPDNGFSIIPAEISGVLVLQGHLLPLGGGPIAPAPKPQTAALAAAGMSS